MISKFEDFELNTFQYSNPQIATISNLMLLHTLFHDLMKKQLVRLAVEAVFMYLDVAETEWADEWRQIQSNLLLNKGLENE
jgi:hypothetical protein